MDHHFDYKNLRTEKDIKIAKERLKYYILMQEDIISNSYRNLRTDFIINLRKSFLNLGMRILTGFLINQIKLRTSKKC